MPTPTTRILDYRAQQSPDGTIAEDKFGAILNGWGYRSVAHVLYAPPLEKWRALFPDLDRGTLDDIFNRYANIQPVAGATPRKLSNLVFAVPRRVFEKDVAWPVDVERLGQRDERAVSDGHVDYLREHDGQLTIVGRAPWHGLRADQKLIIHSAGDIAVVHFERLQRPDLVTLREDPSFAYSGFAVDIEWTNPAEGAAKRQVCFAAQDAPDGPRVAVTADVGACLCPVHSPENEATGKVVSPAEATCPVRAARVERAHR